MLFRALILGMSLVLTLACGDEEGGGKRKHPADSNTGGVGGGAGGAGGAGGEDPGAGGAGGQDPGAGGSGGGAPGAGGSGGAGGSDPGGGGSGGGADCPPGKVCEGTYNFAFVSSEEVLPSALGGISGADARCAQLASDAGLPGSKYIAWLSDTTTHAKERLGDASGWIRPDGRPFAASKEDLLAGKTLYPPSIDEWGQTTTSLSAFTGTSGSGELSPNHCENWTDSSTSAQVALGSPHGGDRYWTQNGSGPCSFPRAFFCLQVDHRNRVPDVGRAGRRAFVSSTNVRLTGGIEEADEICASDASAQGLAGSFKALLATSEASAISRFSLDGENWVRMDGLPIWEKASDAASEPPLAPFLLRADGTRPSTPYVWVGATNLHEVGLETCADWTSTSDTLRGNAGHSNYANEGWIPAPAFSLDCANWVAHLICLEE